MIPLKLELTNFLSYRDTAVIDFNGIHLACIAGANGAGKSSILDAITWSLFGKSRSRSDDDVVNRAAAANDGQAEVQLTFKLEGNIYRVLRRKRTGRTVVLELQLAVDDAGNEWKTLSESGVRATQAAIESLLHMNYDTFTNASFLLQGQADEFTTKTAGQRKEVLADLLGVSQWEEYREAAAARRKETETERLLLDGQLDDIAAELEEEEARQEALKAAQAQLNALSERLEAREELLQQMRQTETAVKQQKQLVKNLAQNRDRAARTLDDLRASRDKRREERDSYRALFDEAEAIEADRAAFQEAEKTLAAWQEKADRYNELQQAQRPHEVAVAQARSRLQQRRQALAAQEEQAEAAAAERETVRATLAETEEELATLAEQAAELVEQEEALAAAREKLGELEADRRLLAQETAQLQKEADKVAQLVEEKPAVVANAAAAVDTLETIEADLTALDQKRERHAAALAEKNNLEAEQPRLRTQMEKHKDRIDRLSVESGGVCPLCGQSLSEEHRQSVLAELQEEGEEMAGRFRANKKRIADLTAAIKTLSDDLRQADRLKRNRQTQQQRQAQAEARLDEIDAAIAAWEAEGAPRLATLREQLDDDAALRSQRENVAELAGAVAEKESVAKAQQEAQRRHSQAEARLAEIDRLLEAWQTEGQAARVDVERRLAEGDYAPEAQAALAELEEKLADLDYDADAHGTAREARDKLADAPARYQQLQEARAAVKPLQDTLAQLQAQIADQEETVEELTEQHDTAVAQLETLTAAAGDLHAVEDEVFDLREQVNARQRAVGAAQQKLDVLDDLRARRVRLKQERATLSRRVERLKRLEKACGRDGVQALLIEHALPDIEASANDLLERLTGGGMRVSFETQRQLKSRDATVETLDIHIQDGAGERPYENFSGGEQFRVNFAIRLALSQILAKRAGAPLQTLVIDEGFGSQDPVGRQRLVEAINTIQDDFARILVITHIAELRDAFPARIQVEKDVHGSHIEIL